MRVALCCLLLPGIAAATPAGATKVFILTDPMTLERRTMVVDGQGPTRFYYCALPPATSGCVEVTPRRR
jgi:hypothetical protein